MIVDLHMHTTYSDGVYTPEQLTQMAVDAGLSVMAISDHDTVAAYDGSHRFAAGVHVIPAIEISSECDGEDVHILGYGIDTADAGLQAYCAQFKERRFNRALEIVDRCRSLGYDIDRSGIEATLRQGGTVGRPHIARLLVAKGYFPDVKTVFDKLLYRGGPAYVPYHRRSIDDGLLIDHNRIVAGRSAKEETNRLKAVRRAIFNKPEDAAAMRAALEKIHPDKLLILGTSKHMIHRICESLHLPEASQFIRIEDVSCPSEIAKARAIRIKEGKHIIPVPTMELKPHFQGYLLDPIRSFFYGRNGKKISPFERSVVRPVFSYYGKLTFSNDVLEALVRHALAKNDGVTKINRLRVAINYNSTRNGLAIILSLTIAYGQNIKKLMSRIRRDIQQEVEYTTGMSVEILKITVRSISQPED